MATSRHNRQLSDYLASHKTGKNVAKHRNQPPSITCGPDLGITKQMTKTYLQDCSDNDRQRHQVIKSSRGSSLSAGSGRLKGFGTTSGQRVRGTKRRLTVDDLPDEVLLNLFSYLPADALMTCSCVCKRWHRLADDNSLWERQYHLYAVNKNDSSSGNRLYSTDASATNWKTKCIRKCIERHNTRINKLLSKSSPYTNLPANIDTAIQKLGITFELVLRDHDKAEHHFASSDSYHHPTACTLRWYSLEFPPIKSLRSMSIIAKSLVFCNKDGSPAHNSPCQRSLVIQHDVEWHKLTTNQQPVAGDDLIDLRVIGQSILVATWKNGGELAFISVNFHNHGLVHRCTQGTLNRSYTLPLCKPKPDDVDPDYGLHGYTCVVELRNQRNVLWGSQFQNVHCCRQNKEDRFARLVLVRPDVVSDHSHTSKKLQLPWKSDLFKGIVQNFCILDVTLHDEFFKPFWYSSSPVAVKLTDDCVVNYNYDGDPFMIDCQCDKGSVQIRLVWDGGKQQYAVIGITLDISLDAINAWFSTKY